LPSFYFPGRVERKRVKDEEVGWVHVGREGGSEGGTEEGEEGGEDAVRGGGEKRGGGKEVVWKV